MERRACYIPIFNNKNLQMAKVIAMGGVPATGKTTLMRKLIKDLMPLQTFKYKLVNGVI